MSDFIFSEPLHRNDDGYVLVTPELKFFMCLGMRNVYLTENIDDAFVFYNEESAAGMALELQTRTDIWFGVDLV